MEWPLAYCGQPTVQKCHSFPCCTLSIKTCLVAIHFNFHSLAVSCAAPQCLQFFILFALTRGYISSNGWLIVIVSSASPNTPGLFTISNHIISGIEIRKYHTETDKFIVPSFRVSAEVMPQSYFYSKHVLVLWSQATDR